MKPGGWRGEMLPTFDVSSTTRTRVREVEWAKPSSAGVRSGARRRALYWGSVQAGRSSPLPWRLSPDAEKLFSSSLGARCAAPSTFTKARRSRRPPLRVDRLRRCQRGGSGPRASSETPPLTSGLRTTWGRRPTRGAPPPNPLLEGGDTSSARLIEQDSPPRTGGQETMQPCVTSRCPVTVFGHGHAERACRPLTLSPT